MRSAAFSSLSHPRQATIPGVCRCLRSLVVIALSLATTAAADETADRLFREGRALMRAGQLADACDRFASSQRLEPSVGTLLNLGDCRERMGQLATAWSTFRAAYDLATERRDRRAAEAGRRAARLETRLSYLTMQVPDPPPAGLVVRRDGVALDAETWGRAVAIDPGDSTIEAEAPGYRRWSTRVHIIPGQRAEIAIAPIAEPPIAPGPSVPPSIDAPPPAPAQPPGPSR